MDGILLSTSSVQWGWCQILSVEAVGRVSPAISSWWSGCWNICWSSASATCSKCVVTSWPCSLSLAWQWASPGHPSSTQQLVSWRLAVHITALIPCAGPHVDCKKPGGFSRAIISSSSLLPAAPALMHTQASGCWSVILMLRSRGETPALPATPISSHKNKPANQ